MGVLDQFGGAVGSVLGQGKSAGVTAVLLQQLVAMLSKPGALGELTSKFQSAGLGNLLQSWIGTGQNMPIDAGALSQIFGQGDLGQLAQQLGISRDEAAGGLAQMLPDVVDRMTPAGQIPDNQSDLVNEALAILQKGRGA